MKRLLLLVSLTGFVLFFAGCTSYNPVILEETTVQLQDEYFNFQLRYMDPDEVRKQFGPRNNPFIKPPGVFDDREFIVFELIIKNKSTTGMKLELPMIEFNTGASKSNPKNAFQVMQYWELEDDDISTLDFNEMKSKAERYMHPRDIQLPPDGFKRGLLVFNAQLPRTTDFSVNLQIRSSLFRQKTYELWFRPL